MTDWFQLLKDLKNFGLSNCEVARKVGLHVSMLNRIKNGEAEPRYHAGLMIVALHENLVIRQNIPLVRQNCSTSPAQMAYK